MRRGWLSTLGVLLLTIVAASGLAAQVVVIGSPTNGGLVIPTPSTPVPPTNPQAGFVNMSSSPVGATNATGGNLAGATDATIGNVPAVTSASTLQLVPIINGVQVVTQQAALSGTEAATSSTVNPGTFNPGVGEFASAYSVTDLSSAYNMAPLSNNRSLAEVAAQYRTRAQQAGNIRTFTNQDLQRINQNGGVTIATAMRPGNIGGSAGATESAAATSNQPAAAPNTIASATSPFSPRSPVTTEQAQNSEASTQAQNSTPQTSEQTQSSRLPASASPLPLIALIGILAGAAGILCKR